MQKAIWLWVGLLALSPFAEKNCVWGGEKKTNSVLEIVQAKDFWEGAGKRDGRKWTDDEAQQLRVLMGASKDDRVRLRANKVLADLGGNGRYPAEKEAIVLAAFRYLEGNLKDASVKKLCAKQGFTHYTVSSRANGSVVFLIEHVQSGGFNGGLNLRWDAEKKAIDGFEAWGAAIAP